MNRYLNRWRQAPWVRLLRLDKPVGTVLLCAPMWAALLSVYQGKVPLSVAVLFTSGAWVMRSLGCVLNDISDHPFDRYVARTQQRPLARQDITVAAAIGWALGLCIPAFAVVLVFPEILPWSILALMMTALYPRLKRFFAWPQFFLGLCFAMSIPMVYAVAHHPLDMRAGLLYGATVLWVFTYDTYYGYVDKDDDQNLHLYSSALSLGKSLPWVCAVTLALSWTLFASVFYESILTAIVIILGYMQCAWQIFSSFYHQQRERYFQLFLSNQILAGLLVLLALLCFLF